ncbi:hypothetical protein [Capnocytophaga sp.]|uniref:hypothetical protein n=1 Tax=Capnocytophaga sp. TaxID=44737 RepID=UPI0026DBE258|nr:hypothetical protein [Capnocytophaga sp.]MDO5106512.1 hypothetical protein [Capnocytophaga sp.]
MKYSVSSELAERIEVGYTLFSDYKIGQKLSIDTGFLSENEVKLLTTTPLRKIPLELIASYVSEVDSEKMSVNEMRYFLPRMLELLAHRHILYISEELSLSKCRFDAKNHWKESEIRFLQAYAETFFEDELDREHIDFVSAVNWLICFGLSGLDIQPLLRIWTQKASELTAIWHFWELHNGIFVSNNSVFYCNYAENHPTLNDEVTRWLNDVSVLKAFRKGIENQLFSEQELNAGVLYHLENLHSVLEKKLSKSS